MFGCGCGDGSPYAIHLLVDIPCITLNTIWLRQQEDDFEEFLGKSHNCQQWVRIYFTNTEREGNTYKDWTKTHNGQNLKKKKSDFSRVFTVHRTLARRKHDKCKNCDEEFSFSCPIIKYNSHYREAL